jgi:hypothetical protein
MALQPATEPRPKGLAFQPSATWRCGPLKAMNVLGGRALARGRLQPRSGGGAEAPRGLKPALQTRLQPGAMDYRYSTVRERTLRERL